MAVITAASIADLAQTTLSDLDRMSFEQIAQENVHYEIANVLFKRYTKPRVGSIDMNMNFMVNAGAPARMVGLFERDLVVIEDHMVKANAPWSHLTHNWGFETREVLMNTGDAFINDIVEPRRGGAMLRVVELLEVQGWTSPPASGPGSDTDARGFPYSIVKNATTGFTGNLPSGHSTIYGIIPDNVAVNYKNWSDTYEEVTKLDLIRKMRKAWRNINWRPAVSMKYVDDGSFSLRTMTNETVFGELEELGEQQNQNLGWDMYPSANRIMFRGFPISWVPYLAADTENPVYMIDMSKFEVALLVGDIFRETVVPIAESHNSTAVHIDLSFQFLNKNRRHHAVLYNPA